MSKDRSDGFGFRLRPPLSGGRVERRVPVPAPKGKDAPKK